LIAWFEQNKKRVATGAAAVLFIALVAGLWAWRQSERKIEAEEALASVRMPYSPLELPAPGTAEALAKVAADYPGTPAAAKALLRAGTVFYGEGNYAKAREHFDLFLRNHGATPWVSEAVFGVAASLDAENKTQEAITKYKDFLAAYSADPAADMARFNLARLYEQSNQPQLALEVLNKMTNPQQPGPSTQEAQAKVRALLAKNPSLMPSNPVVRPTTPSPVVVQPQGTSAAPKIIVNPAGGTPGQPNPAPAPAPAK
jgi:tetratricopeptide (TPR) repeat protein